MAATHMFGYVEKASFGRRVGFFVFFVFLFPFRLCVSWVGVYIKLIWHVKTCLKLFCGPVDIKVISVIYVVNLM